MAVAKLVIFAKSHSVLSALLLFGLLLATFEQTVDAQIGVCYGMQGDLPPPREVISLFTQNNIRRMRIYEPNHEVLEALRGTGIELILSVPNPDIQRLGGNQAEADAWVQYNVGNYAENVQFKYIVVGNEVKPWETTAESLFPAMQNVQTALRNLGLAGRIKVSTAIDNGAVEGFPPSKGAFKPEFGPMLAPVVGFLADNDSPLLVNLYPYFSLVGNPEIHLDYALFTSQSVVVHDDGTNLDYHNLFDALLDTVYASLEKALASETSSTRYTTQSEHPGDGINVMVSEIGWPTTGTGPASMENARVHNNNLVQHVKGGTPKRPGRPTEAYIFSMFDEARKDGDETERHFGIFSPNKELKYPMNFN